MLSKLFDNNILIYLAVVVIIEFPNSPTVILNFKLCGIIFYMVHRNSNLFTSLFPLLMLRW
jgi:hypothetical protein